MAARAGRVVVPNGEGVFADDFGGPVVAFEHQGLDLFRETGDMGALQDATFNDWSWVVYRMRSPQEMAATGATAVRSFVCRTVGPFDVEALRRDFGGGTFEIRGTFDKHLRIRHVMDVEGPRRIYGVVSDPVPMPTPEPAPLPQRHVASYETDELRRRMDAQDRLLERIADRLATPAPPAAPVQAPLGIADVLAIADRLNDRKEQLPTPTGETMKELIGLIRMGMDLKTDVAGGPETTMTERILDKALPSLEKIAIGLFSGVRGPAPVRAAGAPAAPGSNLPTPPPVVHHPSGAVVVEQSPTASPPAAPATAPVEGAHRWPAAIEALARAIERGDEPASFADTLDLLLLPDDVDMLAGYPDAAVVAQLRAAAGGAFPVLDTPAAEAFIAGVLASLREVEDTATP